MRSARPAGARRLKIALAVIVVAIVVAAAVGGVIFVGGGGGAEAPIVQLNPTNTPAPTPTVDPTAALSEGVAPTPVPMATVTPLIIAAAPPATPPDLPAVFLREWGSEGTGDGQFDHPYCIALDEAGNVYVTDFNNDRVQKFSSEGQFLFKWGSSGDGDGQFNGPLGIAVDAIGNVHVVDIGNNRIQKFSSDGRFLLKWGSQGTEEGQLQSPTTIAIDGFDNVYVTERLNHRVQVFDTNGRFLRMWGTRGDGDGEFEDPEGIAVDGAGNVYVADTSNHRVQVFDPNGRFLLKWGTRGDGDGEFEFPYGIAVDGSGLVYVADRGNHRAQVFDESGRFLLRWGDQGTDEGEFDLPEGVAMDGAGNVYVADGGNDRMQVFGAIESSATPAPTIAHTSTAEPTPTRLTYPPGYYAGPLIDAHLHGRGLDYSVTGNTLDPLVAPLPRYDIRRAIIFHADPDKARRISDRFPESFIMFYQPTGPTDLGASNVRDVLEEGVFRGIGEVDLGRFQLSPDDPELLGLYTVLAEYNAAITIKLSGAAGPQQAVQAMETVVRDHPEIVFILGGSDAGHWWSESTGYLAAEYPNIYFTVDFDFLYRSRTGTGLQGFRTTETLLSDLESKFESNLEYAVATLKPIIEANPDRFLWGTEVPLVGRDGYDQQVVDEIIRFSRAFFGRLDPLVANQVAYANAEAILSMISSQAAP